jgi:hypothetical protein
MNELLLSSKIKRNRSTMAQQKPIISRDKRNPIICSIKTREGSKRDDGLKHRTKMINCTKQTTNINKWILIQMY